MAEEKKIYPESTKPAYQFPNIAAGLKDIAAKPTDYNQRNAAGLALVEIEAALKKAHDISKMDFSDPKDPTRDTKIAELKNICLSYVQGTKSILDKIKDSGLDLDSRTAGLEGRSLSDERSILINRVSGVPIEASSKLRKNLSVEEFDLFEAQLKASQSTSSISTDFLKGLTSADSSFGKPAPLAIGENSKSVGHTV